MPSKIRTKQGYIDEIIKIQKQYNYNDHSENVLKTLKRDELMNIYKNVKAKANLVIFTKQQDVKQLKDINFEQAKKSNKRSRMVIQDVKNYIENTYEQQIRPSGITIQNLHTQNIVGDIYKWAKKLQKELKPNQIMKLVLDIDQDKGKTFLLNDFIDYLQQYDPKISDFKIVSAQLITVPISGGCDVKSNALISINIDNIIFQCKTVKTKDNNCFVVSLYNQINEKIPGNRTDLLRTKLGIKHKEQLSIEECESICKQKQTQCRIYFLLEGEIKDMIINPNRDNNCKFFAQMLLHNNHFYTLLKEPIKNITSETIQQYKIANNQDNNIEWIREDLADNSFDVIKNKLIDEDNNNNRTIFIHGKAGTGKSTLSNYLKDFYDDDLFLTASTGQAANLINGITIHLLLSIYKSKKVHFKKLLIDEISMIDGQMMQKIIQFSLKHQLQLIFMGDLYQLPPVQINNGYFFEAIDFATIYNNSLRIDLTIEKRSNNQQFNSVLKSIRDKTITINELSKFVKSTEELREDIKKDIVYILSTNKEVQQINEQYKQQLLDNDYKDYQQDYYINNKIIESIEDNIEKQLSMKKQLAKFCRTDIVRYYIGEKVMVTKNIVQNNIYNGLIGIITQLNNDSVEIMSNGQIYNIPFIITQNAKQLLLKKYIPLKTCYAITIHKSQGKTIDSIIVSNIEKCFHYEQLYVLLSRVRKSDQIYLQNFKAEKVQKILEQKLNYKLTQFIEFNEYQSLLEQNIIEDHIKMSEIPKPCQFNYYNKNSIYLDFETANHLNKYGQIEQKPYFNHIIHYYKDEKKSVTYSDLEDQNCDVANQTYLFIKNIIYDYANKILSVKDNRKELGTMFNSKIKCMRELLPHIIYFNGANFDLYFIYKELLKDKTFDSTRFRLITTFKGQTLVIFRIYDTYSSEYVLSTLDLCQILQSKLKDACSSYCSDQALKLEDQDVVLHMLNYRYLQPNKIIGQQKIYSTFTIRQRYANDDINEILKKGYYITRKQREQINALQNDINKNTTVHDFRNYSIKCYRIVDVLDSIKKYAINDTEILVHLLKSIDDLSLQQLGTSVFKFSTIGQMSWYGFLTNLPNECIQQTYDSNRNTIDRKKKNKIKTKIIHNEYFEEKFIRSAVYGGLCCPRMKKLPSSQQQDNDSLYTYLDISGMYAYVMKQGIYPYGQHHWIHDQQDLECQLSIYNQLFQNIGIQQVLVQFNKLQRLGIFECDFEENTNLLEPIVPFSSYREGSQIDDLAVELMNKNFYTLQRRTQRLTSLHMAMILANGGIIHKINKAIVFDEKSKIMDKWIQKTLDIKNQGEQMNKKKASSGNALRSFGKLLANGSYGQSIKQDRQQKIQLVKDRQQCNDFLAKNKLKNCFYINDKYDLLIGDEKIELDKFKTSRCSYIGAYVLSYSRYMIQLFNLVINPDQKIEDQPAYGDTDSLLVKKELVIKNVIPQALLRSSNGFFTDELMDNYKLSFFIGDSNKIEDIIEPSNYNLCDVINGIFSQPKTIAIQYINPKNKQITEKIRTKGISIQSDMIKNEERISYQTFIDNKIKDCHLPQKPQIQLPVQHEIKKKGTDAIYGVFNKQISRQLLKTKWIGRQEYSLDNNYYIPYGYKENEATKCLLKYERQVYQDVIKF